MISAHFIKRQLCYWLDQRWSFKHLVPVCMGNVTTLQKIPPLLLQAHVVLYSVEGSRYVQTFSSKVKQISLHSTWKFSVAFKQANLTKPYSNTPVSLQSWTVNENQRVSQQYSHTSYSSFLVTFKEFIKNKTIFSCTLLKFKIAHFVKY
jgi:hypothetical protein